MRGRGVGGGWRSQRTWSPAGSGQWRKEGGREGGEVSNRVTVLMMTMMTMTMTMMMPDSDGPVSALPMLTVSSRGTATSVGLGAESRGPGACEAGSQQDEEGAGPMGVENTGEEVTFNGQRAEASAPERRLRKSGRGGTP